MASKKGGVWFPFLSEIHLFEGLPPDLAGRMFVLGKSHIFRKGDAIIREGKKGGDLHIIVSGQVDVWKKAKGGGKRKLATLGLGTIFGEMSVFDGSAYSATVSAAGDCVIHIIKGKDFLSFLEKNPKAAFGIMRSLVVEMASRLRNMNIALSASK